MFISVEDRRLAIHFAPDLIVLKTMEDYKRGLKKVTRSLVPFIVI